jgi:hypothetical protein
MRRREGRVAGEVAGFLFAICEWWVLLTTSSANSLSRKMAKLSAMSKGSRRRRDWRREVLWRTTYEIRDN